MNHTLIQLQENIQLDVNNACASVTVAVAKINATINVIDFTCTQNTHNAKQLLKAKSTLRNQINQLLEAEHRLLFVEELEIEVNKIK
ncbi:hypothetical protein CTM97_18750 [Photobacterium phosphoreum]|uniref:Uncharacterized protein n=1 Tax=Photobacterium phosphoreum TaxID=659 RepID=A0A2T3JTG8_PHOPO|nr:hypothetical protein [Photobacterium phosphoreum]PSU19800.1 hypothetical protein CTM96_20615 [Photobacterium phosphoreum]PSU38629.1 hypothetical protein CTM97_18750 [Photobacterium phosphoreum]PSU52445.1 hypothetical protein C9J18_09910 [Photobacterium phosphoreum]